MERVKVQLPDQFNFTARIPIRITDLNYGGHVGNDVFLSLLHEARQQFLLHHGYSELSFEGCGLIMADAAIEYKHELAHGDVVEIAVAATGFDKIGFDLYYRMELVHAGGNQLAAKAKTGMLCYDYAQKKKVPVPAAAIAELSMKREW
ncbi:acyl-CoA thioesterase [Deminuibacter soli]|uniref:Thioesterase n=1 Tax=Deminuibacter soli TaxID=2291815 RepID=A0A3E1NEC9_9BACT|nr:thioesterase family protein [Deminuibacter soli]RFM26128.1 thioesterase [Deminuibacter soli]